MLVIPLIDKFVGNKLKRQTVADTVDQLNHYLTAYILFFFASAISAKQFFGNPIQCWAPAEFKDSWVQYADDYCFIANSYYVPFEKELPALGEARADQISYYRWVPMILAIQAVCFLIPNYAWNAMHKKTAINPRVFLEEAQKISQLTGFERQREINKLANFFMESVSVFENVKYPSKFRANTFSGKNAMGLYLLTKGLYVINIVAQLRLISRFLGVNYTSWGYQFVTNRTTGSEWEEAPVFPRVIMCDFQIRSLGNIHNHTVQCVLMLNIINEKIFLFLSFWLSILGLLTFLSCCYYLVVMLLPRTRSSIVKDMIKGQKKRLEYNSDVIEDFVHNRMRPDGVLLLQFINEHSGERIAFDLIDRLLAIYISEEGFSLDSMQPRSCLKSHYAKDVFHSPKLSST